MKNLFVVEADPVIALDIAETLRDCVPLAQVHIFKSLSEAERALANVSRPALSVISLARTNGTPGLTADLLRRLSDRIVLIGETVDIALDEGWSLVTRPFSTDTLARAITRLVAACRPSGPS